MCYCLEVQLKRKEGKERWSERGPWEVKQGRALGSFLHRAWGNRCPVGICCVNGRVVFPYSLPVPLHYATSQVLVGT